MADFTIELTGEQFKRGYLLYVIEIQHKTDHYYYVGQTGDRNYITARPAFRRLSGHFEDRVNSTQNQIYKYLVGNIIGNNSDSKDQKYDETIKQGAEDFLADSKVIMHIYKVFPFNPGVDSKEHRSNVNKIVQLERNVISSFASSGKLIMNKAQIQSNEPCPYPEILTRIKVDFELD